jgi:hypothetical protein
MVFMAYNIKREHSRVCKYCGRTYSTNARHSRVSKKYYSIILMIIFLFFILPLISSAPQISITYPPNNTNSSDINLDVNYFVSETDLDSCWYNDNLLENISLGNGGVCVNITEAIWNDGIHNIIIWANDTLGDENSSSVRFTINTTVPLINIIYPLSSNYNLNIIELNYTSDGISCWYSLDNGITNSTPVSCGINFTDLISVEGTNIWTIYANNSLGNEAFDFVSFVQDTINPSISIIYPLNIVYYGIISTLNYLTDGIASNNCWYSLDNGITNISAMISEERGRGGGRGEGWGMVCDTELSNLISIIGSNTWTIYINDTAGNVNSSSVTFVISSWTSETGETVYNLMNGAGAGLGNFMTNIAQGSFGFLVIIGLIAVFIIIGFAVAMVIVNIIKSKF